MQLSLFVVAAVAACTHGYATSSYVRCNDASAGVVCPGTPFKHDSDTRVLRCKPRADSTEACSVDFCCQSFTACNSVKGLTCPAGYKTDPKTHDVMRCKPWPQSTQSCTPDVCCLPATSGFTACDEVAGLHCAHGYNVDAKTGGVMRCKPRLGSTVSCSEHTCCAPPPPPASYIRCSDTAQGGVACNIYKKDPVVGDVMRCKTRPDSNEHCSPAFCCAY